MGTKKRKLNVVISGLRGAGKTTLAILIRDYLRSIGIAAVIENDSTVEYHDKHGRILDRTTLQPMDVAIRPLDIDHETAASLTKWLNEDG